MNAVLEMYTVFFRAVLSLFVSFIGGVILAPLVISGAKKLRAGQPILGYVEQHATKAGTPTFGGFVFLVPSLLVTVIFSIGEGFSMGVIAALVMASFAILGFLDDFIKIKTKDNLGLRPYQKIFGQLAIAIIVAVYAYRSPEIGSAVYIPFYAKAVDFGFFYIPFAVFVYLALSNCVNLTDGLDGLILFTTTLIGGVLAFLLFNTNKAKIFMGDTGSLALGGASAAVALFSKQPFLILFVGIMYIVSGISIILQVTYFKITHGKRIFLMAPFHHHLEKKGLGEAVICNIYATITLLMGVMAILSVAVADHGIFQ